MRYNTNIYQRPVVGFICVLLIFSSVSFVAAVQPGEIPLIGLNLSGMGMGQTLGEDRCQHFGSRNCAFFTDPDRRVHGDVLR